jgi:protein-tyrosine sulfotransferase
MMASSYEGVVVLGFPRSGTTLLRRLLDAHPGLCCPPETVVLAACGRFLREEEIAGGVKLGVVGGLAFSGIGQEEVLEKLRGLAFGFFRQIRDSAGKRRWVEKNPYDVFYMDTIERLCADYCRYICLVRHPLDVVCSTKEMCDKAEIFPAELHEYVRQYQATLEAFAHAWVDTHRRLLQFEADHPDWCIRVRYEELVADPCSQLERICQFLGEPTDFDALVRRAMAETGIVGLGDWKTYEKTRISDDSVGRWQSLSPHRIRRLAAIVNPLLGEFGYPEIVVEKKMDPQQARHLYQKRMWVAKLKSETVGAKSDSAAEPTDGTVGGERQEHGS